MNNVKKSIYYLRKRKQYVDIMQRISNNRRFMYTLLNNKTELKNIKVKKINIDIFPRELNTDTMLCEFDKDIVIKIANDIFSNKRQPFKIDGFYYEEFFYPNQITIKKNIYNIYNCNNNFFYNNFIEKYNKIKDERIIKKEFAIIHSLLDKYDIVFNIRETTEIMRFPITDTGYHVYVNYYLREKGIKLQTGKEINIRNINDIDISKISLLKSIYYYINIENCKIKQNLTINKNFLVAIMNCIKIEKIQIFSPFVIIINSKISTLKLNSENKIHIKSSKIEEIKEVKTKELEITDCGDNQNIKGVNAEQIIIESQYHMSENLKLELEKEHKETTIKIKGINNIEITNIKEKDNITLEDCIGNISIKSNEKNERQVIIRYENALYLLKTKKLIIEVENIKKIKIIHKYANVFLTDDFETKIINNSEEECEVVTFVEANHNTTTKIIKKS